MGRRTLAAAVALAALGGPLGPAAPAQASTETLRRAAGNVLLAPLDLVLAPAVAGHAIHENLKSSDDSTAVKVVYTVPGFLWNTGVVGFSALIRELAGLLELLPGLALLPFERDLAPLFDAAERSDALVDVETPPLRIRFGIDYTSG